MMKPTKECREHPDYPIELKHAETTIQTICHKIETDNPYRVAPDKYWEVYGGADENTAMVFRFAAIQKWEELRFAAENPYFGRIDFREDQNSTATLYVGKNGLHFDGVEIIDWRAPIAQLFYRKPANSEDIQTYLAPGGIIKGKLLLKRHLQIDHKVLWDLVDEFDWRSGRPRISNSAAAEEVLLREIYTRGDPRLQDIVKTIQDHQDRLIRSPAETILVINGVPGSGKTSIAFHRVAYLLYPATQANINPGRTIIFGPNRLFMSFVKDLLPSLNVPGVQQVAFDDWALERIGFVRKNEAGEYLRKYQVRDSASSVFVDPHATRSVRRACWKRARIKGSLKFSRLIERYVAYRRQNTNFPAGDLVYANLGEIHLTLSLTTREIQDAHKDATKVDRPLGKQHERMFYHLRQALIEKYEQTVRIEFDKRRAQAVKNKELAQQLNDPDKITEAEKALDAARTYRNIAFAIPSTRRSVIDEVENRLKRDLAEIWPPINLREDFYTLLADGDHLHSLGRGLLREEEINLLNSTAQDSHSVDLEDVPGLLFLHQLLYGIRGDKYDHIVVDEAQDFSPLQFRLLHLFSKNNSMTILGDIAQGIHAHRGISDWAEIKQAFPGDFRFLEINQSYRSTREIVEFNNEVLRTLRKEKANSSIPLNRSGEKPHITITESRERMFSAIHEDVCRLLSSGIKNIGLITKTSQNVGEVVEFLGAKEEYHLNLLTNRDEVFEYGGGAIVLPVALSKGIEFQAVLVIDVNENKYNKTIEYDGRLLYVAITRALHFLHIYSTGRISGYLEKAKQKATVRFLTIDSEEEIG
jgi:DNA helicase-2/ATP-dependent DNA helicase PcrA